ncbi:MAG: hypothetical protein PHU69_08080 [Fermentimonas sp.]|nr:hypothetical protein [Fermentimonas sp.]
MKEKLLALLQTKFAGVRKDGLNQLATVMALTVTTEEEATSAVDKLTEQSVGQFVTDWRKDVDSEISKANKTYEDGLRKKYDFKEKGNPNPPTTQTELNAEAIAAIVQKAIEPFASELNSIKTTKVVETRKQLLAKELEGLDEGFRTPYLNAFDRMNFNDDEDFNTHLTNVKTEVAKIQQSLIDKGLSQQSKPMFGSGNAKTDEDVFVQNMKAINTVEEKK